MLKRTNMISEGKIKEIESEKLLADNRIIGDALITGKEVGGVFLDASEIYELDSYRRRKINNLYKEAMKTKHLDFLSKDEIRYLGSLTKIIRSMKNLNNLPLEKIAKMRNEEFAFKEINNLIDGIEQGYYEKKEIIKQKFHQLAKKRLGEYVHKLTEKDIKQIEERIKDIIN